MMHVRVRTCLWFAEDAEIAVSRYVSLISGSAIEHIDRKDNAVTGEKNGVVIIDFQLAGTPYRAMNPGPHHAFNDAMSIVVTTPDQAETDRLWDALAGEGGTPIQCGWLRDRWGVSWQIIPSALATFLCHPDRAAAGRAMQAMLEMQKIDIAVLERAFNA
jgi:predicted 3-demethylubiquinone-9 3-methyltransferase (glyoxalase superfamily)